MKKRRIHTGCSSYNSSLWQPLLYSEGLPRKQWFEYYCQHFSKQAYVYFNNTASAAGIINALQGSGYAGES